jgi:transposase-like protein
VKKDSKPVRKRTQRDYSMAFKLHVISEVEKGEKTYKQAQKQYGIQGRSTVLVWLRKHGTLDWSKPSTKSITYMSKQKETPAQEIKRLKRELEDEKLKSMVLNKMIDTADNVYGISIRKKYLSKQSENSSDSKA